MPKGPSMRTATLWMVIAREKRAKRIVELHDTMGFGWEEIAELVDCSSWNVRRIYKLEQRAREDVARYRNEAT